MKNKFAKKVISCVVSVTLATSLFGAPAIQAFAVEDDGSSAGAGGATTVDASLGEYQAVDTSSVDSVYFYDGEQTLDFHWRDEFFYGESSKGTFCLGDSTVYNPSLATMSLHMAWASYNFAQNGDYSMGDKRLLELTSQCGFTNFEANEYYQKKPEAMSVGVGIASKKITIPGEGVRTLISVTQRSGGYDSEWSSNTTLGSSGEALGFATGRDEVISCLIKYFRKYGDSIGQNPRIWISGFSRGSAIGNLSGNFLDVAIQEKDGSNHPLMSHKHMSDLRKLVQTHKIQTENVYSYGIEVPKGGVKEYAAANTKNLHVCWDPNDMVPYVAPAENWNFQHYGQVHDISVHTPETVRGDLADDPEVKNGGADRTSKLYLKELEKIDAGDAASFKGSLMHKPFTAYHCTTTSGLYFGFGEWDPASDSDNVVGKTLPKYLSTLMTRLTEACGKRSDYNVGLQKTAAVLSKVIMTPGSNAAGKLADSVWDRFCDNLGTWLLGTLSSVSSTWKTTERIYLWSLFIGSAGLIDATSTVEEQMAESKVEACKILNNSYKDLLDNGLISQDDYKDLTDSTGAVYDVLIKLLEKDNETDYQLVSTALIYAPELFTFHMPSYVTTHLVMNDPLYSTPEAADMEGYKLDVLPVAPSPNYSVRNKSAYSKYVAVDVYGVKGDVRTPLAKIRDGKVAYYSTCPRKVQDDCIFAAPTAAGLISVLVKNRDEFKDSFDKAEFVVTNDQEGKKYVADSEVALLNFSYDYYLPGDSGGKTQDLEKGLVKFANGDRLTMTCEPGPSKENGKEIAGRNMFDYSWTYRALTHYVDKDFKEIDEPVDITEVKARRNYGDPMTPADITRLPEERNALLSGVKVPASAKDKSGKPYTTCELTTSPARHEDGSYDTNRSGDVIFKRLPRYMDEPTCGETATGVIRAGHLQNSMDLYVVCRSDAYDFSLDMIQSEMSGGKVKTAKVEVPDGLDGVYVNASKTGQLSVADLRKGLKLRAGELVTINILKMSDSTGAFSDFGTFSFGDKTYRVEGWQFDENNKDLSPVLTSANQGREAYYSGGTNLTGYFPGTFAHISFVMPANDVHLDGVLRGMSNDADAKLFSFAGSLKITDADGNKIAPSKIGLEPVSSDSIATDASASDLAASDSALMTYKIKSDEGAVDSSVKFPVMISVTAADLPASGAEEFAFDHWATYSDSDSSKDAFKFITTHVLNNSYRSNEPKFTNAVFERRADNAAELQSKFGSLRLAPVYKELGFGITIKDAFGTEIKTPNQNIPQGEIAVMDYELPKENGDGSFISGIEGTYIPVAARGEGGESAAKKFTDFEFVSKDGGALGEGCQSGSVLVTVPKGDVTLTVKTSHNVYVKYNDDEPQLVGTYEAGSESVSFGLAVPFGQEASVSSSDADVSLNDGGTVATIASMPAKPVTVNVTTKAKNRTQTLKVTGGTVFVDGKDGQDEALKPNAGTDGEYSIDEFTSIKIVPNPEEGKLFDKWSVVVPEGVSLPGCMEDDGTLYFGMPGCDVEVKALFANSLVVKSAIFALDGDMAPGSALPAKATTNAPGVKDKEVAVTWEAGSPNPVEAGKSYTGTFNIQPAEKCAFPVEGQLDDMVIQLAIGQKVINCSDFELNADGSLTVTCDIDVLEDGSVVAGGADDPDDPADPDNPTDPSDPGESDDPSNSGGSGSSFVGKAKKITSVKLKKSKRAYTGKAIAPSLVVKYGDKRLVKNVDYTVKCYNRAAKSCKPKKIGTYKVKVIGKGKYAGTFTRTFKIVPTRVFKVKVKALKKGFKAKWKKKSKTRATGYQVRWSKSSKFKKYRTSIIKKRTVTSKKKTKLRGGRTYYVKVRAYKVVNGKKYYGAWSKVKKVKTRK